MTNKKIVITGASGGVGTMLALGLAKKGAFIICLGRNEENLKKIVAKIKTETSTFGGNASYAVADMTNEKSVTDAAEKILA